MSSGSNLLTDEYESRKRELKVKLRLDESSTESIRRTLYFHHLFSQGRCNEIDCVGCDLLNEMLEDRHLRLVVDNS